MICSMVRDETRCRPETGGDLTSRRSFKRGAVERTGGRRLERTIIEEFREPGTRLPEGSRARRPLPRKPHRHPGSDEDSRGAGRRGGSRRPRHHDGSAHAGTGKSALLRLFRDQPIPTLAEMEHMIELREVLEETVAGLAAVRATEKDLQQISAALTDMAAAGAGAEETIAGRSPISPCRAQPPTTGSSRWCSSRSPTFSCSRSN